MAQEERKFVSEREIMVSSQLEAAGIKDKRLLEAMRKVKRHLFVSLEYRHMAYGDYPVPIGHGQAISQPEFRNSGEFRGIPGTHHLIR